MPDDPLFTAPWPQWQSAPPLVHNTPRLRDSDIEGDRMKSIGQQPLQRLLAFALVLGAILVARTAPSHAQEQEQSLRSLLGRGFEIKGTAFARGESTDNRDAFVVTLQKDKSIAVCYFASTNWINLSAASLDDARRCEVR